MGEVINLNKVRKAKKRAEAAKTARENRARFGASAVEREKREAETRKRESNLDGARLEDQNPDPEKGR